MNNTDFFQNELKGFVLKRVKDKDLADDIVQDVFIKVQTKYDQLNEDHKITNWIYQIAQNTITDHYRKKSRKLQPADLDLNNETGNFNECVARYLKVLITKLPANYREAIELIEFENLSQLELADRLGISYTAAKSRVQRARRWLKTEIEKDLLLEIDCYGNAISCKNKRPCC